MSQPLLHFCDVGAMLQGIGGGGCPHGVHAKSRGRPGNADLLRIELDHIPDGRFVQGLGQGPGRVVLHRPEQRPVGLVPVLRLGQVGGDEALRGDREGNIANLFPLALNAQMPHALAALDVPDLQLAQLFPPDAVIEEHGQDRPVALALQRPGRRGLQQPQRLLVSERRRCPLAVHRGRAPDAQHRIMQHGMAVTEIIIQGGQGREFTPDGVVGQAPALQVIAPGEDMRPGHLPQLLGAADAGKGEKLPDIPLVILTSIAVAQIGEPFGFRGDGGQSLELYGRETVRRQGDKLIGHAGFVSLCFNSGSGHVLIG